jgi:hypothetical protein
MDFVKHRFSMPIFPQPAYKPVRRGGGLVAEPIHWNELLPGGSHAERPVAE